jgi:hypothetical protein
VLRAAVSVALLLGTYALAAGEPPAAGPASPASPAGPAGIDDAAPIAADSKVGSDCSFKGKKLYGKVKVVQHFADFKVKVVEHFQDLSVQTVEHFPDSCGKWQFVEHFPDFTITYVEHFPDFTIKKVQHFPGRP